MKNLANCKPSEFLRQTNRIRKSAEKWLKETDILGIRKNVPKPVPMSPNMTDEEKKEALAELKRRQEAQARENLSAILDAVLDKHPDETLELLALLCFVEPEHADDHPVSDYLDSITEMLAYESVVSFFTSLARWGVTPT